jgi:hypothetical protein
MKRAAIVAMLTSSVLARQESNERAASSVKIVRVELPQEVPAPSDARSVSIDEIEKLWIVERTFPEQGHFFEPAAYGRILETVGDVDGGGGDDLLVGTSGTASESVDLILGEGKAGESKSVHRTYWNDGVASVTGVGDVDQDGFPDFAIVEHDWDFFRHRVKLFVSREEPLRAISLSNENVRRIGGSVAPLRGETSDLDGDGWVDLVVTSELVNWSATGHLMSSRTGEFLADLMCEPTHDGRRGIERVATQGRWIAISSPLEMEQRGRVRVWTAATRELSLVIEGTVPGKYLGARIAWLDDQRLAVSMPWAGPARRGAVIEIDVKKGEVGRSWRGAARAGAIRRQLGDGAGSRRRRGSRPRDRCSGRSLRPRRPRRRRGDLRRDRSSPGSDRRPTDEWRALGRRVPRVRAPRVRLPSSRRARPPVLRRVRHSRGDGRLRRQRPRRPRDRIPVPRSGHDRRQSPRDLGRGAPPSHDEAMRALGCWIGSEVA